MTEEEWFHIPKELLERLENTAGRFPVLTPTESRELSGYITRLRSDRVRLNNLIHYGNIHGVKSHNLVYGRKEIDATDTAITNEQCVKDAPLP